MLAQWVSWAAREQFGQARTEPLITLGSAPLQVPEFRAVVLGQLGESRLDVAIDADLAGEPSHARALDADTTGSLRDIHRRVGTAVLFESSGGQVEKVAHLPELRFALGEPEVDTTTVDNAASALEASGFFIRKIGTDGYRIHHQATLKKVVSDRRASLDEGTEIKPALRGLVQGEFKTGATLPVVFFPEDSAAVQDSPRLVLVVLDPETEWTGGGRIVARISHWTKERGSSPRLYPGSLVWCARGPGRGLRDKVELLLAWRRVAQEVNEGRPRHGIRPRGSLGSPDPRPRSGGSGQGGSVGQLSLRCAGREPGGAGAQEHRPGRRTLQRQRDALRTDHQRVEGRGPAQRVRRRGLYRPALAALRSKTPGPGRS